MLISLLIEKEDVPVESCEAGVADVYTVEDMVERMGFGWYQLAITLFSGSLWVSKCIVHGKILARKKLANLANRELFVKIFLTKNVLGICSDFSLFAKIYPCMVYVVQCCNSWQLESLNLNHKESIRNTY